VTLLRVRDEQDWDYTGPVKGIAIYLHQECEPFRLEFDKDLYVQQYTKTQFSGLSCHLKIIELLKKIQPYFRTLNVSDEGEFWETGDEKILRHHFETIKNAIEEMCREAPGARTKVKEPNGRISDLWKPSLKSK
jgi:hypothetical protein